MLFRTLIFTLFIIQLIGCSNNSYIALKNSENIHSSSNITVLNYYPNCAYQVLGIVSGHSGLSAADQVGNESVFYKRPSVLKNAKGTTAAALMNLKLNAEKLGANAIAIIHYYKSSGTLKLGRGHVVDTEKHSMRAEAIKLCPNKDYIVNSPTKKLVKFNERGQLNLGKPRRVVEYAFDLNKFGAEDNQLIGEGLISSDIQIGGKVLGFSLGMKKDEIIKYLGNPSAIIRLADNFQAFLFGRKHLFLFDRERLIGYEHSDWFLPLYLNNLVSFNDELYEADITINKRIKIGDTLAQINKELDFKATNITNEALRFSTDTSNTELAFIFQNDLYENTKIYLLNGISIYKPGYQKFDWDLVSPEYGESFTFLDLSNGVLLSKTATTKEGVIKAIGLPNIEINRNSYKETWVYGSGLIIDFINGNAFKYTLQNKQPRNTRPSCEKCLYIGQPVEEIPNQFVVHRTSQQITLENNGLSYLVNVSEEPDSSVDYVEVVIK